ncbi:hypothetical protein HAX54_028017, partial [Datura stramonium]|nr:hypothetical protein [Datura stramonium]
VIENVTKSHTEKQICNKLLEKSPENQNSGLWSRNAREGPEEAFDSRSENNSRKSRQKAVDLAGKPWNPNSSYPEKKSKL